MCGLLIAGAAVLHPQRAEAATVRDFTPLFKTQTNGATVVTGNSLLGCDTGNATCRNVLNGSVTGSTANNNSWTMVRIDADDDSSTSSSSSARITIPDGGKVLYAGLFWGAARSAGSGGTGSSADGTTMRFRAPGSASYDTITSSQTDYLTGSARDYSSYADVTDRVRNAGSGSYWGADVAAGTGSDRYAGWSLVVTYQDPAAPLRDLTVFGGYARITGSDVENTTISGFLAPPSGAVNARFGMVVYEGDVGITGDYFAVNNAKLSDALSPAGNFFSSRISDGGTNNTDREPASVNNLGPDSKVVDAPGMVPNGATSAQLTFATSGDAYYPAALTTGIDLYAPTIQGEKAVKNVSGNSPARIGDTLEYTLTFSNSGDDDALGAVVRDVLPPGTTYVPGSLRTGTTAQTDDPADDLAEYDSAARTVRFRVGAGANQVTGGRLTKNATATVRFRVKVDRAAAGTTIVNTGFLDYTAETLGTAFSYETPPVETPVAESADLAVKKTSAPGDVKAGQELTYTLTVRNNGPSVARDTILTDDLPAGLTDIRVDGTGCTTEVSCKLGDVPSGETRTVTIRAKVDSSYDGLLENTARTSSATPDPNPGNNTDGVTDVVGTAADLSLTKAIAPTSPVPGQPVTFTITVHNAGPSTARDVAVTDPLDASLTPTAASADDGSTCTTTGGAVRCSLGDMKPDATVTITVTADLSQDFSGNLANTAGVTSPTPDPDLGNNVDTVEVGTAPAADLAVRKTASIDRVVAGGNLSFELTVTNHGPSAARDAVLDDTLPDGLTVTGTPATSAGSCTVAGQALRCSLGTVGVGATVTVRMTATVAASYTASTVTNVATVLAPVDDPTPENNTDQVSVVIDRRQPPTPTPTPPTTSPTSPPATTPPTPPTTSPTTPPVNPPTPTPPRDGDLADTGSSLGLTVPFTAAGALLAGLVLLIVARRRGNLD